MDSCMGGTKGVFFAPVDRVLLSHTWCLYGRRWGLLTFMRSADHVGGDERHLAFVWKAVRLAQVHPFRGPLESEQHLALYGGQRAG
jgi:hypothetical protein